MARFHLIKNGVVANTVLWDATPPAAAYPDCTVIDGALGAIGWLWNGSTLSPPPVVAQSAPVPASISRLQLTLGLVAAGLITAAEGEAMADGSGIPASINAAINGLPADQRSGARIRFKGMTVVDRANPLIDAVGLAAGGKSPAEMDAYFVAWSKL